MLKKILHLFKHEWIIIKTMPVLAIFTKEELGIRVFYKCSSCHKYKVSTYPDYL